MEPYFYCTYGGIRPICSDCKRNHINSPYKTSDITTWLSPSYIKIDGTICSDYISIKESTMVNKQEFIDKVCKWLDEEWGDIYFMPDIIEALRKKMEE